LGNQQLRKEWETYKAAGIRHISIKSFEPDGSESKGFFCKKKFSKDYRKSELGNRSAGSAPSLLTTLFDDKGHILSTLDTSEFSVTQIRYTRDASGRILSIQSRIHSADEDFVAELNEEHQYSYEEGDSLPKELLVIRPQKDTDFIVFARDEKGRISIEKSSLTGKSYYYYYDDAGRLTDIVREQERNGALLPDYMFEYDDKGRMVKMTSTEEASSNYWVWLYMYNEQGLRIKEKIFSKERQLVGSLGYEYK